MSEDRGFITAETLVEATKAAGRPPLTLEEAERELERAVELGYLMPASEAKPSDSEGEVTSGD